MQYRTIGVHRSNLARRIAHLRGERDISRADLARLAGIDEGYLEYLEEVPAASPTRETVLQIAEALGTTVDALYGADLQRPPGSCSGHSHGVLEHLSEGQCLDFLGLGGVGRVVFVSDRGPVAVPVNFKLIGGEVMFRTTKPFANLIVQEGVYNGTVGFEVDRIDEATTEGWSVLVTGKPRLLDDVPLPHAADLAKVQPWAIDPKRQTLVAIDPKELTGRFIRQRT